MTIEVDENVVNGPAESLDDLGDAPLAFSVLQVEQPIGTFYVGVMSAHQITAIAEADVRRLESELDQYLGFQRELNERRVRELTRYVTEVDASFPTSIVLAIDDNDCLLEDETLYVRRDQRVATIIDGQHRIAGLRRLRELEETPEARFDVIVTIFVNMHIEDQARVFATINLNQTKVNRSLALDLFEFARSPSPSKTAHDVAKALNNIEGSPLHHRIKMLGTATPGREETVSQALIVDGLLHHMSPDPAGDRNALKQGKQLDRVSGAAARRYPFRNLFVSRDDLAITENVWNFFEAVGGRWPTAWGDKRPNHHLNRNTGVWALLRFLGDCYTALGDGTNIVPTESYLDVLRRDSGDDDSFSGDDYAPGSPARSKLLRRLREALS